MAVKNKKVKEKNNDLNDFVDAKNTLTEENTVDSPTGKVEWDVQQGEVHSNTTFEDDQGHGKKIIVRSFDFKANPEAFRHHTPSKQELFNAHANQIETILWKDGLQVMGDVAPRLMLSKKRDGYRIVVGAEPAKGFLLHDRPQTLTQIANAQPKPNTN